MSSAVFENEAILTRIFRHLHSTTSYTRGPFSPFSNQDAEFMRTKGMAMQQEAIASTCRVNKRFSRMGLPILWEGVFVRTPNQLARLMYSLENGGNQYVDHIQALVICKDPAGGCEEDLRLEHSQLEAFLISVMDRCKNIQSIDVNWENFSFASLVAKSQNRNPIRTLRILRLFTLWPISTTVSHSEWIQFNALMNNCQHLETLELTKQSTSARMMTLLVMKTCKALAHFTASWHHASGLADGIQLGYCTNLRSIKMYSPSNGMPCTFQSLVKTDKDLFSQGQQDLTTMAQKDMSVKENMLETIDPQDSPLFSLHEDDIDTEYRFEPSSLSKVESINLGFGTGPFVEALFDKPELPQLKALRIQCPSESVYRTITGRLASQLEFLEMRRETTMPAKKEVQPPSCQMPSLRWLDCSPCSPTDFLECGNNITTLSVNSSLKLLNSLTKLCPNLEDITLWGGCVPIRERVEAELLSRLQPSQLLLSPPKLQDPETCMIRLIQKCPIRRLRLVDAYFELGPKFWSACGESAKKLTCLDIELLSDKGLCAWGLFEGLQSCSELQFLRLTELFGIKKEMLVTSLPKLRHLQSLYLSIHDLGSKILDPSDIVSLVAQLHSLSETSIKIPRPTRSSTESSTNPDSPQCPALVNAQGVVVRGSLQWSKRGNSYLD